MAGLRERQKAERGRRILQAASARFRAAGYDATRIEEIAEAAGVSVGTLYNYFGAKGDVLVAIVSLEVEEILAEGAALVAAPCADAEAAVAALIGLYYDHSLVYLSKAMWRTAMAMAILTPDSPASRRYAALDARLSAQVCELVASLQAAGAMREDVDAEAVGQMLFNNLNQMFLDFTRDEAQTLEALKALVARQNRPLLGLAAAGCAGSRRATKAVSGRAWGEPGGTGSPKPGP